MSTSNEAETDLGGRVYRLTKDTVVKFEIDCEHAEVFSPEGAAADLVFHHTIIPVPRVRRVLRIPEDGYIAIVMDYVPGQQLRYIWPSMSLLGKLRVVLTIRDYIRQLRAIRHPRGRIPGPVAPGTMPLEPRCHMIRGPLDHFRPEFAT